MGQGDDGEKSQFGIALRLPVESLDADLGLYAAQITSRTPFIIGRTGSNASAIPLPLNASVLNPTGATLNWLPVHGQGGTPAEGAWVYPSKVDIFGLSAASNIAGWSVAAELSHSPNVPAQVIAADILAGTLSGLGPFADTVVSNMGSPGTQLNGFDRVGKSQLQVNGVRILSGILSSTQMIVAGEVAYQRADVPDHRKLSSDRYGRAFIFGPGYHPTIAAIGISEALWCSVGNSQQDGCKNDGFVTKNSWGYRLRLGLEYPGFMGTSATFYPTISFSHDVKGYSVDNQFIEDRQTLGLSGRWNINKVHNVEVSYVRYGDQAKYDPFRDRDFYSLVLSTTF
jgi:hypothetical protein